MAKRIISIIAVVILAGLYIATMISAILTTPATKSLFIGSLTMTIIAPVVLWIFMALYRRAHKDDDKNITMTEMRRYRKRIKQGESPEKIAKEIEEKYKTEEN